MDTATASATTSAPTLLDVALTALDRCDRCSSQAYVRAVLPAGTELLFCGHHANEHKPALIAAGAAFRDETDRLTAAGS